MNIFDKICAVLAFALGIVLLLLGVFGLFTGCRAHFALPPILGVIPALVGWGILKPIIVAWNKPRGTVVGSCDSGPFGVSTTSNWPTPPGGQEGSDPSR